MSSAVAADLLSLEKSNIEDGRVKVNKLEQVHLESEGVLIFSGSAVKF